MFDRMIAAIIAAVCAASTVAGAHALAVRVDTVTREQVEIMDELLSLPPDQSARMICEISDALSDTDIYNIVGEGVTS